MNQESEKKSKKEKKSKSKDPNFDKERAKIANFDIRGVQTLFRTLSRNHYNLLRMVDNKASIILTINSIISSLLMGALFVAPEADKAILGISSKIMIVFSMFSMIFALISMLPHKYIGRMYEGSDYKGSLYAANFTKHSLPEFRSEFNRIIQNGQTIYDEMIMDLYFLGRTIHGKQIMLIISSALFILGLISAITYNVTHGLSMFQ